MKLPLLVALLAVSILPAAADAAWRDDYAALLQKYVKPTGVDYESWAANAGDKAKLKSVADAIGEEKPAGSQDDKLAFYINAYNAWTLHHFVKDYPYENSNALKRTIFFSRGINKVAGESISFRSLENDIIRAKFSEPRIHFALNCASASCPPLLNRPYVGSTLDADLTTQTRAYLNDNPLGVTVKGNTASISEIFDWFAADFGGDAKAFINKYRVQPLGSSVKIEFQKYDWSRNDAK